MTPGAYLLYTLNFTTLVSGPIQRYDEFARDQFPERTDPARAGCLSACSWYACVRGFFKVSVLSGDTALNPRGCTCTDASILSLSLRFLAAFRLAVVYPFFLYCNFSGYIDIVIALARLMRVRLPENLTVPFQHRHFLTSGAVGTSLFPPG